VPALSKVFRFAAYVLASVLGLLALLATLMFAFSLADIYALTLGGVSPGDPMMGDRFAPSLPFALVYSACCGMASAGSALMARNLLKRLDKTLAPHSGAVV
jgi:hypothetical protein